MLRSYMFGSDTCGKLFDGTFVSLFKANKNVPSNYYNRIESSSFIIVRADVMKSFANQKPKHRFLKLKITYVTLSIIM